MCLNVLDSPQSSFLDDQKIFYLDFSLYPKVFLVLSHSNADPEQCPVSLKKKEDLLSEKEGRLAFC